MNFNDRIIGALVCSSVCDAVGNPFEFRSTIDQIDVVDYYHDAKTLIISDDSQMNYFGMEAMQKIIPEIPYVLYDQELFYQVKEEFTKSYIEWYKTQLYKFKPSNIMREGLIGDQSMYSVQSPGNTCLDSLYTLSKGKQVINDSKGCGSTMRLVPLLQLLNPLYGITLEKAITIAQITGNLTHKHKENDIAIALYMQAAYDILFNPNKPPNLHSSVSGVTVNHISDLGEGWTALESVNMAIWAYTTAKSFDELVGLSVAHGGDSDSVACIAGGLWGFTGHKWSYEDVNRLDAHTALLSLIKSLS